METKVHNNTIQLIRSTFNVQYRPGVNHAMCICRHTSVCIQSSVYTSLVLTYSVVSSIKSGAIMSWDSF